MEATKEIVRALIELIEAEYVTIISIVLMEVMKLDASGVKKILIRAIITRTNLWATTVS